MNTKKHFITKRIGALLMAVAMMCTMAVCASAAGETAADGTYTVTIKKAGKNEISMANDIVAGPAVVTATNGKFEISIPIKPIKDYAPMGIFAKADGYMTSASVAGATNVKVVDALGNTPAEQYDLAYLQITLNENVGSNTVLNVTESNINLYKAGTQEPYTIIKHLSQKFDIYFE